MIAATEPDLLHPLSLFCRTNGRTLPLFEAIEGAAMPEPYRSLLVHRGDMTSRLEEFHRSALKLRVLHREHTAEVYRREVLLCTQSAGLPVEYGAIEIHLEAFAPDLRELILEGRQPLGGLLNTHGISYGSEPKAFIRLAPDEPMNALFETAPTCALYGRCNVLLGSEGETFARIVEVLRPLETTGA